MTIIVFIAKMSGKYGEMRTITSIIKKKKAIKDKQEIRMLEMLLKEKDHALKVCQNTLQTKALRDETTDLPNSFAFYQENRSLTIESSIMHAVLLFDIDRMKYINETMGHAIGDCFLKKIAQIVQLNLLENHILYRLAGDEFVIVLKNMTVKEEVVQIAKKVCACMQKSFYVEDLKMNCHVSIGLAAYPENGNTMEELLQCADIAMREAKKKGGNQYVQFEPEMKAKIVRQMKIEKNLLQACCRDELNVYYQPQVDTASGNITGYEALLRWNNSELGEISPEIFIKVAEETGQIVAIGKWVLQEACRFIKSVNALRVDMLSISVNISMVQLLQDDFVEMLIAIIKEYQLPAEWIEIEITESMLMQSYEKIKNKLKIIYNYGIKIALDDFGKGYSSLGHLQQLPISTLKIDKLFIDRILTEKKGLEVVEFIIMLGKSLNLTVVAEGVEIEEQYALLVKSRCNKIQGYYFSKAVPEDEAIAFLQNV